MKTKTLEGPTLKLAIERGTAFIRPTKHTELRPVFLPVKNLAAYDQRVTAAKRGIMIWNCVVCLIIGISIGFAITAAWFATWK